MKMSLNQIRRFSGDEAVNVVGGGATETADGNRLSGQLVSIDRFEDPNIYEVTVLTGHNAGLRFIAYSDELWEV
jgi:hypothetical protein